MLIADTFNYGRALFLDGSIQSSEDDEALYHEMLVQPAMLRHPNPRDVLIIGGGEGATLREVLVHRSVNSVTMVDLDREVVELCREHLLPWHRGAFDDRRVRLVYGDGRKFVEDDDGHYDVVIVDVVDMLDNGPAQALYTRQFYERLRRRLRPDAIVVVQGLEFSFMDDKPHVALSRHAAGGISGGPQLSRPYSVVFGLAGAFVGQRLGSPRPMARGRHPTDDRGPAWPDVADSPRPGIPQGGLLRCARRRSFCSRSRGRSWRTALISFRRPISKTSSRPTPSSPSGRPGDMMQGH